MCVLLDCASRGHLCDSTAFLLVGLHIFVYRVVIIADECVLLKAKRQLTVVLVFSILYNVPKFAEVLSPLGDSDLYYIIYSNILYLIFLLYLPLVSLTFVNVRLISALKALKRKRQEMQQVLHSTRRHSNQRLCLLLQPLLTL